MVTGSIIITLLNFCSSSNDVAMIYLLGWCDLKENISHSYCLDQSHNKAYVIANAEKYPCYLHFTYYTDIGTKIIIIKSLD